MRMERAVLLGLLAGFLVMGCDRGPVSPPFLEDQSRLLSAREEGRLTLLHDRFLKELDIYLKIVVLDQHPSDLDDTAAKFFASYTFDSLNRGARGLMLMIDPQGGMVRMEIGSDLEEIFPGDFIGYLEGRQMEPFFASGRVANGIEATVELLIGKALGTIDETLYRAAPPQRLRHGGRGSGARASGDIAAGATAPDAVPSTVFMPQATPLLTLAVYREVLRGHVKDPELPLYTEETRQFFHRWLVTDVQQDNELRGLEEAWGEAEVIVNGPLAVIRFPLESHQNSPYFLRRHKEGWQLDLAAMNRLVGFNHRNQWHFNNLDHGYMFGFGDWQFDTSGFPHRRLGSNHESVTRPAVRPRGAPAGS